MSDFDKEAERERLREKYEQEQADREATEKMSELLLQGATMTNAHCQECGDPIFRYDGQEFCATCEKTVERDGDGGAEADEDDDSIEVADPSDGTRVQFGGDSGAAESDPAEEPAAGDAAGPEPATAQQPTGGDQQPDASPDAGQPPERPAHDQGRPQAQPSQPPERTQPRSRRAQTAGGDENLHATRAALERTLANLTSQAEACDDPRDAEAYLAAAREAAETLAALRH